MPEDKNITRIRGELEEITKQLVKTNDEYEAICKRIDKLPNSRLKELKGLCVEKDRIFQKKKFLE